MQITELVFYKVHEIVGGTPYFTDKKTQAK